MYRDYEGLRFLAPKYHPKSKLATPMVLLNLINFTKKIHKTLKFTLNVGKLL